jgi:hypothetical protein
MRALRPTLAAALLSVGSLTFAASAETGAASDCHEIRPATETAAAVEACREDVYLHVGGSKLGNTDTPVWDTTAPTTSYTAGGGGGFYQARLLDILEPDNPMYRPPLSGTFTGVLDSVGVTAYVAIPGYASRNSPYPLLAQLIVDGRVLWENAEEVDVPLTAVPGNNATRKIAFNFTNVSAMLEKRKMTLDGEHKVSIAFTPRYWGDGQSVVFYDAVELPTGVQFNVDPTGPDAGAYTEIDARF